MILFLLSQGLTEKQSYFKSLLVWCEFPKLTQRKKFRRREKWSASLPALTPEASQEADFSIPVSSRRDGEGVF